MARSGVIQGEGGHLTVYAVGGQMQIDVREPGRVVALTGRLDVVSVADVRLALHAAVDDGAGDLVLDLSAVDAVDSSGIGVLVGAHRRAGRAGRRLVVAASPAPVLRMLRLTRLDRVLTLTAVAPAAAQPVAPYASAG